MKIFVYTNYFYLQQELKCSLLHSSQCTKKDATLCNNKQHTVMYAKVIFSIRKQDLNCGFLGNLSLWIFSAVSADAIFSSWILRLFFSFKSFEETIDKNEINKFKILTIFSSVEILYFTYILL